ncbi:MAG: hypothetical protein ABMA13_23025 [Chthoniobacteraceae bacterium]
MKKYFGTALQLAGPGVLAREIEAEDFDQAVGMLRVLAREKFGADHRLTSVTEHPTERSDLSIFIAGATAGEQLGGAWR